jgi:hypothetical protein
MTEELAPNVAADISPMSNAQCQLANAFFPLLFPVDALRMVPLAIYRKITI